MRIIRLTLDVHADSYSFLLPSIAPYVSWGLYSLWTQFILGPDFQILHPRNTTALLMALHIKVVLAVLVYCDKFILPITKIFGPGWHFLVPCIISMRLNSQGVTAGDYMMALLENVLPRRIFPRLRPITVRKDAGAVDKTVSPVDSMPPSCSPHAKLNEVKQLFQLLPGLHESYHALVDSLQLGLRAEVVVCLCIARNFNPWKTELNWLCLRVAVAHRRRGVDRLLVSPAIFTRMRILADDLLVATPITTALTFYW
jgi:hypothetical protein